MKKRDYRKNYLSNNKGAALVSVMIAVAFVTILASALLYITYSNYQMKILNLKSKNNFYETNGELTKVTASFRDTVIGASNPVSELEGFCYDDGGVKKYDVKKIVANAYKGTAYDGQVAGAGGVLATLTKHDYDPNKNVTTTDHFGYSSMNNIVEIIDTGDPSIKKYVLHDFEVAQVNSEEYKNEVKTDIILTVQELAGGKSAGGVGEFSMLLDSTLDVTSSDFGCVTLYGNSYLSSYGGVTTSPLSTDYYIAPKVAAANGSGAALVLSNESKMNILGEYMVVYGDVVLKDNSCLFVGDSSLTVYGDIYLEGNATLVCSGDIFMVDSVLPGRGAVSDIYVRNSSKMNKDDHVFPAGKTVSRLNWEAFNNFCSTLDLKNATASNLDPANCGLINKISTPVEHYGTGNTTLDLSTWPSGRYIDGGDKNFTYYGKPVGVGFNNQDTINGNYKNFLVFNFKEGVKIRESNINTTIVSKFPLKLDQKHDIMLTKIGGEAFNFLTINSTDTTNPLYKDQIHHFQATVKGTGIGGESRGYLSAGDLFDDNCNATVNQMLNNATGGAGGAATFNSALQFENFSKDYEN